MLERLIELETDGWEALVHGRGAEHYEETMTDDAVMVVPGLVLSRAEVIESFQDAEPWSRFEIQSARVVPLWGDGVTLVYLAVAQREGEPEYRALMSSTYVRSAAFEPWKLAFHQQTPVPA